MEPLKLAQAMEKIIRELGVEGQKCYDLVVAKADAMSNYDKEMSIAVAQLKSEGEPVSIIDKKAKGMCHAELHAKILAEEMLKAHYSKLDRLKAQLNGLQSMNRHLAEV